MHDSLQKMIGFNKRVSAWFDRTVLPRYTVDGATHYTSSFLPRFVAPRMVVYDVGGGRSPVMSKQDKQGLQLLYVGIDISDEELRNSPEGVYDRVHVSDLSAFRGNADADVVICRAVLEHVRDVRRAFRSLSSILKPGGRLVLFVPCRNALYARLNLLLGDRVKRWLLFSIHPHTRGHQGFTSFYDQCTPGRFERIARENGLVLESRRCYQYNFYLSFFFPFHLVYRLVSIGLYKVFGDEFCEAFSLCLRRVTTSGETQQ